VCSCWHIKLRKMHTMNVIWLRGNTAMPIPGGHTLRVQGKKEGKEARLPLPSREHRASYLPINYVLFLRCLLC
jgi:hypothetical protein